MNKEIFKKRIPFFLAFFLLFLLIVLFFFIFNDYNKLRINEAVVPQEVKISNLTDNQAAISWFTSKPTTTQLKYGLSEKMEESSLFDDNQFYNNGKEFRQIHYLTLKNLKPETTYYFQIKNGELKKFTTSKPLISQPSLISLKGRVIYAEQKPAEKVLVTLNSELTLPLTVLTDKKGYFTFFPNQALNKDLTDYVSFNKPLLMTLEASDAKLKTSATILWKNTPLILPEIILGNEPYDFSKESQTLGSSSQKVILENPAYENEKINTQKPEFFGRGPAGKTIQITIESDSAIKTNLTIDEKGNWSYSPTKNLQPGEHKITISYFNDDGSKDSITRTFYVLAASSENNLPAFTATASAKATPSLLPQTSSSPSAPIFISSEPPRSIRIATEQGVPVTGIKLPTLLLAVSGLILIFLAFIP